MSGGQLVLMCALFALLAVSVVRAERALQYLRNRAPVSWRALGSPANVSQLRGGSLKRWRRFIRYREYADLPGDVVDRMDRFRRYQRVIGAAVIFASGLLVYSTFSCR